MDNPRFERNYIRVRVRKRVNQGPGKRAYRVLVPNATKDPEIASKGAGELAREIAARLGVRRKFYRAAFALYSAIVLGLTLGLVWTDPARSAYALTGAAAGILGTAAVFLWAYSVRKSALYEEAGRRVLGGK